MVRGKLPSQVLKFGQNQNFLDNDKEILGQNLNCLTSDRKNLSKTKNFRVVTKIKKSFL